jgi:Domain of unknown function (DUF4252)
MKRALLGFVVASCVVSAQEFHEMINFDALKAKAQETVEVNLDGNLLHLAMNFLSDRKPEEAEAKKLIGGIKGIYVRSLRFEKEGMYSIADVDRIRGLMKAPEWSKVVNVSSTKKHGDNVGVFVRTDGKQMMGLVVLAAEPEELTVVNIVGVIDPAQVRALGGKLGIPQVWDDDQKRKGKKGDQDKEDEE